MWLALANILWGWMLVEQGEIEQGIGQMRESLVASRAMGIELDVPYFLTLFAKAYEQAGQAKAALEALAEALIAVEKIVEYHWEAELYRLKGELLLKAEGGGIKDEAEACFQQAIAVARRQEAKSLELRAVMSLSRLWQAQDKKEEAHQILAGVYNWFTEGFDTADLKEAQTLLEELK